MIETFTAIKSFCLDMIKIIVTQILFAESHLTKPIIGKYTFSMGQGLEKVA